jgi:hypothetical protein
VLGIFFYYGEHKSLRTLIKTSPPLRWGLFLLKIAIRLAAIDVQRAADDPGSFLRS